MVSVIIPAYNAEKTIEKAVESVLNQTCRELEVIIVDDGSKDRTAQICDRLAAHHSNVTVRHIQNAGVSAARNVGLETAMGEYIVFIDSDDEMMSDMVAFLLYNMEAENADISVCGVRIVEPNGSVKDEFNTGKKEVLESDDALKRLLRNQQFNTGLWTKMFRKEILKDLTFVQGIRMHEDKYYIFQALLNAKRVVIEDIPKYIYIRNAESATMKKFDDRWFDIAVITDRIQNDVALKRPELMEDAYYHSLHNYYVLLNMVARQKNIRKQYGISFHRVLKLYKQLPINCIFQCRSIGRIVNCLLLRYITPIYCLVKGK